MPVAKPRSTLAQKIASVSRRHDNEYPLWKGPCGEDDLGGITQSMLVRFLSCRERFRLKYVCGLEPYDKWNHRLGYGNMWHACEEALAGGSALEVGGEDHWQYALDLHTREQLTKCPFQREEITKWYNVCKVQFPEYVKHWREHSDVRNRTPLMQEKVFDVPYRLPSGRVVRLRGKFDSVDLIDSNGEDDIPQGRWIYLQENKTKSDIDKEQVERQLRFDLQTMMYLIALREMKDDRLNHPIVGVRYNVVRRPLSGGIGSITPHKAKSTKATYSKKDGRVLKEGKFTPAETDEEFYERLRRDYLAADPGHWFFRVRAEVSDRDVQVFKNTCLTPLLETLCWWYDEITNSGENNRFVAHTTGVPSMHYRTPFGVYSALEEGGSTEYDACLETGSEAGLRRVETLFTELQ